MNWSKIKSIMIFFLVAMNLFIAAFIAFTTYRNSAVPDKVIEASVKILKRDGFSCDKKIIPKASYVLPVLDTTFYSASDLSKMFFGKQVPFRTEENSLVADYNDSTLTVSDNHFVFKTGNSPDTSHSASKIKSVLKDTGLNMDGAVYDEKERCFYRMYKGTNLFNMYIKAELDSSGNICEISAMWPGKLIIREEKELTFVTSVTKLKDIFPDGGTITLIEKGYSLKPLGNEKYLFTPAWRVKVDGELKIIE